MKICLITAFPPGHERLNEYGFHLAQELQRNPLLSVTILADEFPGQGEELPGFDVLRCWTPNHPGNSFRLLKTIHSLKPDIVWYNLVFSTFGTHPVAAFLGLWAPLLTRAAGYSVHVTLHQLMEGIDLKGSGIRYPGLYRAFGRLATHLLLCADSVTVLLPTYGSLLREKYRSGNVHFRAHGVFTEMPQYPDFSRRGQPPRLLAFGKWGTYKRLELLLESFPEILKAVPDCRLLIAGEDHPAAPGYLSSLRAQYAGRSNIEFAGYVGEADLPDLFATASILVMPYDSTTGSSGVAHQACQFGLPIVCASLVDFREMARAEGLAIAFYERGNGANLAAAVIALLQNPERQRDMADQNYAAAVRHTMPQVVRQYLRSFDWQLRPGEYRRWRRPPFSALVSAAWNTTLAAPATSPIISPGTSQRLRPSPSPLQGERRLRQRKVV